ncbi:MAG: hypothetical protein JXB49_17610 [Bacteroidales bacterium]|nr:hypothetical protein [Bacteroidales bacterium]
MACLEILLIDEEGEIPKKAAEVLKIRPRDNVILKGWLKIVKHYPHDLLEKTLRELMVENQFRAFVNANNISPLLPHWFITRTFPDGILHDYQISGNANNFDSYLKKNYLEENDGLFKAAWRCLLINGTSVSLKKERADRILFELIKPLNAPFHIPICQNYLNVLTNIYWDERILNFIADKYNPPISIDSGLDIDTPFWKKVNKRAKEEFNTWYISKRIEDFFEGERADFWKKYVPQNVVKRVKMILNGEGFLLDFGTIGVIEFKKIGNAAYIYPRNTFAAYWSRSEYSDRPDYFKNLEKTIRERSFPGWDGRIIHREGWQSDTASKINKLIG